MLFEYPTIADTFGRIQMDSGIPERTGTQQHSSCSGRLWVQVPPGALFRTDQDACGMSPATYLGIWPELTQREIYVRHLLGVVLFDGGGGFVGDDGGFSREVLI